MKSNPCKHTEADSGIRFGILEPDPDPDCNDEQDDYRGAIDEWAHWLFLLAV